MSQGHICYELRKARPAGPDDVVRLKMRSENGGKSRWVSLPHHVYALVVMAASLTEKETQSLVYALSCLTEDPDYLSSPETNENLQRIYGLMCSTEGEATT